MFCVQEDSIAGPSLVVLKGFPSLGLKLQTSGGGNLIWSWFTKFLRGLTRVDGQQFFPVKPSIPSAAATKGFSMLTICGLDGPNFFDCIPPKMISVAA